MWPGLADNDEASPMRVRDNQGFWERVRKRERERVRGQERGGMRCAVEARRWRERAGKDGRRRC